MKILMSLIALLFAASLTTYAAQVNSITPNVTIPKNIVWQPYSPSIFIQAKKMHQPIILFAKSESCHWCKQMEEVNFNDAAIIKLINENYLPVILDVDKDMVTTEHYFIIDLPTIIILDSNDKPIKEFSGYIEVNDMTNYLNEISNNYKQQSLKK